MFLRSQSQEEEPLTDGREDGPPHTLWGSQSLVWRYPGEVLLSVGNSCAPNMPVTAQCL